MIRYSNLPLVSLYPTIPLVASAGEYPPVSLYLFPESIHSMPVRDFVFPTTGSVPFNLFQPAQVTSLVAQIIW